MDKKEFDIKIKAMLNFNKKIHTKDGATTENIKKLNYLIIEMMAKGCKPQEIYTAICTGRQADRAKYDLVCRVTEQIKYPTLVYSPDITYTDDLTSIKNCALDESMVRASNWYKNISGLFDITPDESYRFTQCYMLLEQFGREEMVIDEAVKITDKIRLCYLPAIYVGKSYHDKEVEINTKIRVISKLIYSSLSDYPAIQQVMDQQGCRSVEEYNMMLEAYGSGNRFFALKSHFDALHIRGVQGDASRYVFQTFKNGVPFSTNKYKEAYSMADAAKMIENKCSADFAKIGTYVNPEFYDNPPVVEAPPTDDDVM